MHSAWKADNILLPSSLPSCQCNILFFLKIFVSNGSSLLYFYFDSFLSIFYSFAFVTGIFLYETSITVHTNQKGGNCYEF